MFLVSVFVSISQQVILEFFFCFYELFCSWQNIASKWSNQKNANSLSIRPVITMKWAYTNIPHRHRYMENREQASNEWMHVSRKSKICTFYCQRVWQMQASYLFFFILRCYKLLIKYIKVTTRFMFFKNKKKNTNSLVWITAYVIG